MKNLKTFNTQINNMVPLKQAELEYYNQFAGFL